MATLTKKREMSTFLTVMRLLILVRIIWNNFPPHSSTWSSVEVTRNKLMFSQSLE